MKILRYIHVLAASLLIFACTKPFDLGFEDSPAIFLESFPGVEDMVVFSIKPAYSYSNSATRPDFNPEIIFKVNGRAVPVVLNTGFCMSDKYYEDVYVADYKPVPGDEMTVEVSSEGFMPISARTTIPAPFPERKVYYRPVTFGGRELNVISVRFLDDEETDCAYGMQVYKESVVTDEDGNEDRSVMVYAGEQPSDDFDFAPASMDGIRLVFNGWFVGDAYDYDYNLAGWDDDRFNGEEEELSMTVHAYSGYESFFESEQKNGYFDNDGVFHGFSTELYHNKLVLYTMSEEFHNYVVAQALVYENAGFFAGLAPSNFCYSNVEGGYGAFAGVYCVDTPWITKEFIENN